MSIFSRESLRRLKRRLMAPLKPLEGKVRGYCQYFILKTIQKHGIMPTSFTSGNDGMANALLLPLLQSKRRIDSYYPSRPEAVAIGGYLLTSHPRAVFFYHDPADLTESPWILRGDYQPNVTAWLCANVAPEERVLVLAGGQGYHTLTIASQLNSLGKVMVLNLRADDRKTLELNLRANRLDRHVDVHTIKPRDLETPGRMEKRRVAEFAPTLTIVDLPPDTHPSTFANDRWHVVNCHAIQGGEIQPLHEFVVDAKDSLPLRKAG